MEQINVGDQVKDIESGRIGTVTEVREGGKVIFVRPGEMPYRVEDKKGITGVSSATILTATAWYLQDDGCYDGIWVDACLDCRSKIRRVGA